MLKELTMCPYAIDIERIANQFDVLMEINQLPANS